MKTQIRQTNVQQQLPKMQLAGSILAAVLALWTSSALGDVSITDIIAYDLSDNATNFDLTAIGTTDWVMFNIDQKNGAGVISSYSSNGADYAAGPDFTWEDGTFQTVGNAENVYYGATPIALSMTVNQDGSFYYWVGRGNYAGAQVTASLDGATNGPNYASASPTTDRHLYKVDVFNISKPTTLSVLWNQQAVFAAALTVGSGVPIITAQPQSQAVVEGSSVTFSVTAEGTPPLSYQWQYNGTNIDGANAATLTLNDVGTNQIGTYTVTVANGIGLGFTPSQPASLLVGISYPLTVQLYAGLQVLGTVGLVYSIQCTPDLTQTNNWQTLTNLTLPSSPYLYIDTASPDYPRRFYRVVLILP